MSLIPAERLTNWTPGVYTGVIGGIPTRTSIVNVTGLASGLGNSAANTTILQGLIDAASTDDVILIPSGTWHFSGMNLGTKAITVRGAGMDETILVTTSTGGFYAGSGNDYSYAYPAADNIDTSGTRTKGSNTVTLTDVSAFSIGQMVLLHVETLYDDTAIEGGDTVVYQVRPLDAYVRKQMARVTGKAGSVLTFFPPLHFDCTGQDIKVTVFQQANYGAGIEDLTIDCSDSAVQNAILFEQCYGSWIRNVKITNSTNYGFFLSNCLNCELTGNFADRRRPGGSNGGGFLVNTVGSSLYVDNIAYHFNPGWEVNQSSTGNVIAYNLIEDPRPTSGINTNHNPHNSFNLYEGNISPNTQCDGYYGSASEDTHYRNWYTGFNEGDGVPASPNEFDQQTFIIGMNRFTRKYSLVGNILGNSGTSGTTPYSFGNPNIGNSDFTGTAQPSAGDFWSDWKATGTLTARTSDTQGTITLDAPCTIAASYNGVFFRAAGSGLAGNMVMDYLSLSVVGQAVSFTATGYVLPALSSAMEVYPGENGFQEQDRDVFWDQDPEFPGTTLLRVNRNNWTEGGAGIPEGQELGEDEFPDSLAYSAQPDWWPEGYTWPPIDPTNAATASYESLPAAMRFLGEEPSGDDEVNVTTLNVTTLVVG